MRKRKSDLICNVQIGRKANWQTYGGGNEGTKKKRRDKIKKKGKRRRGREASQRKRKGKNKSAHDHKLKTYSMIRVKRKGGNKRTGRWCEGGEKTKKKKKKNTQTKRSPVAGKRSRRKSVTGGKIRCIKEEEKLRISTQLITVQEKEERVVPTSLRDKTSK